MAENKTKPTDASVEDYIASAVTLRDSDQDLKGTVHDIRRSVHCLQRVERGGRQATG